MPKTKRKLETDFDFILIRKDKRRKFEGLEVKPGHENFFDLELDIDIAGVGTYRFTTSLTKTLFKALAEGTIDEMPMFRGKVEWREDDLQKMINFLKEGK